MFFSKKTKLDGWGWILGDLLKYRWNYKSDPSSEYYLMSGSAVVMCFHLQDTTRLFGVGSDLISDILKIVYGNDPTMYSCQIIENKTEHLLCIASPDKAYLILMAEKIKNAFGFQLASVSDLISFYQQAFACTDPKRFHFGETHFTLSDDVASTEWFFSHLDLYDPVSLAPLTHGIRSLYIEQVPTKDLVLKLQQRLARRKDPETAVIVAKLVNGQETAYSVRATLCENQLDKNTKYPIRLLRTRDFKELFPHGSMPANMVARTMLHSEVSQLLG